VAWVNFRALRTGAFRAVPLAPGYKEGKGKVENPFRYVEGNFLLSHRRVGFQNVDDLNEKAMAWLRTTAWVRNHGTTQESRRSPGGERPHPSAAASR
jgi:transposase